MVGTWKKGPGVDLFQALEDSLGSVPILAGGPREGLPNACAPAAAIAPPAWKLTAQVPVPRCAVMDQRPGAGRPPLHGA